MRFSRSISSALVALVTAALLVIGLAVPASAASGAVTVELVSQYDGTVYYPAETGGPDFSMPSGEQFTLAVNYTCESLTDSCTGGSVTVHIPNNTTIINNNYPLADVDSVVETDNTRQYLLKTLSPGASAQISFKIGSQGVTSADGALLEFFAEASTENGLSNSATSKTLQIRLNAEAFTSTAAALKSGGALGTATSYTITACLSTFRDNYGIIGVAANSTLSVHVPVGLSSPNSADGVWDPVTRVMSWTLTGAVESDTCVGRILKGELLAPNAVIGQDIELKVDWNGRSYDQDPGIYLLATNLVKIAVTPPSTGGSSSKQAWGTLAPSSPLYQAAGSIGDQIIYTVEYTNSGTTDWTSVVNADPLPEIYKATKLTFSGSKHADSTGWIKTDFGQDGIDGNSDDNTLFQIADFDPEVIVEVQPYEDSNFTGLPLDPADRITYVEQRTSDVRFSESGTAFQIFGEILAQWSDGSPVSIGTTFTNRSRTSVTDKLGTTNYTSFAITEVKVPVMRVQMRTGRVKYSGGSWWEEFGWTTLDNNPADGTLSEAERQVWGRTIGWARESDLANPRVTFYLPKNVSYLDWAFCSQVECPGLTYSGTPTINVQEDFAGSGRTVATVSFPKGAVLAKDAFSWVNIKVRVGYGNYGNVTVPAAWSSASGPAYDVEGYFPALIDDATHDFDGDGSYPEALGQWPIGFPMPNIVSAIVNASVKGSWDLQFSTAPAVSYTSPGADDVLRADFVNGGTTGLTDVHMVTVFARPGDDGSVTANPRNSAINTFPMLLRAKPEVFVQPGTAAFTSGYDMFWTTEVDPCIPEVGNFNPVGCTDANWTDWDATAPVDPKAVTAVLVDFKTNKAAPGDTWTVEYPTTTPTTGASESEWAAQSSSDDPADYETADASFGIVATPYDMTSNETGLPLSRSESMAVTLAMPSENGPNTPPNPEPLADYTYKGLAKSLDLPILNGGHTTLLDAEGNETNTVVLTGQGTYTLNPETGVVTFTPAPRYTGYPPAIGYRVYNFFDLSGDSTVRFRVLPPTVTAPRLETSSYDHLPQSPELIVPDGGSVKLLNNGNQVDSIFIEGEGTYSVNLETGQITFEPVEGFLGQSTVRYRLIGPDGDFADNDYLASVGLVIDDYSTFRTDYEEQFTEAAPEGHIRYLLDEDGNEVRTLTVDSVGTWTVAEDGSIHFLPATELTVGNAQVHFREYGPGGTQDDGLYTALVFPGVEDKETTSDNWEDQTSLVDTVDGAVISFVDPFSLESVDSITIEGVGTFTIDEDGHLRFSPVDGFIGSDVVTYRVDFGMGIEATATYLVTVTFEAQDVTTTADNEGPQTPFISHPVNTTLTLVDGDGQEVSEVVVSGKGTFAINEETGEIYFTPVAGFRGSVAVNFRVQGKYDFYSEATYTATVTGGSQVTVRKYKKVVWLYFDKMSPRLKPASIAKLRNLIVNLKKVVSIGFVQGYRPQGNAKSLSRERAFRAARWLRIHAGVTATVEVAKGVSKNRNWKGRAVKLVLYYEVPVS